MKARSYSMDSAVEEAYYVEPEPIEFAETTIGHTVQAKFELLQ